MARSGPLFLTFLAILGLARGALEEDFGLVEDRHKCEPISIQMCKNVGYTHTAMPNLIGIDNQRDADEQLATFRPLIKVACSSQLHFFLCSVYAPMCTEQIDKIIGPCRPLCQSVRKRCEPMLQQFGFSWPPLLNCDQFPENNDEGQMCMKGPGESEESSEPPLIPANVNIEIGAAPPVLAPGETGPSKTCPHSKSMPSRCVFINNSGRWSPMCPSNKTFSDFEQRTASIWMGCLSGICLIVTIASLLAVLTSSNRFRYPEKPVVFITLCYGLSCIGYMVRLFSGYPAVACTAYGAKSVLVVEGLQNIRCTVVFIFQYYFGMVALLWWLILCFTWCLAVGPGWSSEAIELKSTIYHLPAWILPGLLTVVIIVRQTVEADELTGICNVGNASTEELLRFLILPLLICLVLGMALLTVGFASALCCCQRWVEKPAPTPVPMTISHPPTRTSGTPSQASPIPPVPLLNGPKLDNFLLCLGILAVFYIVPSACLLASHFYEYSHRPTWLFAELHSSHPAKIVGQAQYMQPNFSTLILKIVASMLFGIISAGWLVLRIMCHYCGRYPHQPKSVPISGGRAGSGFHSLVVNSDTGLPPRDGPSGKYGCRQPLNPSLQYPYPSPKGHTMEDYYHGSTII